MNFHQQRLLRVRATALPPRNGQGPDGQQRGVAVQQEGVDPAQGRPRRAQVDALPEGGDRQRGHSVEHKQGTAAEQPAHCKAEGDRHQPRCKVCIVCSSVFFFV